jgi:hypothetical protein
MSNKISNLATQSASELAALDLEISVDVSATTSGSKKMYAVAKALGLQKLLFFENTGTADACVISTGLSLASLSNGFTFALKLSSSNTTTATLSVDNVGVKTIKVVESGGLRNVLPGELKSGMTALLSYNGTYFILLNSFMFANILVGTGENPGDVMNIVVPSGTRGGITVAGTGDTVVFNDIKQALSDEATAAASDGDVTEWSMSMRKDGRFSEDYTGKATWEFYAHRKNSTIYYAPLLFSSTGDLTLVGARQDAVGGYTAVNGRLSIGEKISTSAKATIKNDNGYTYILTLYDANDKPMLRFYANGKTEWMNSSDETLAMVDTGNFGHVGFGRGAISGAVIATLDKNGDGISMVNYDSTGTEKSRISADGTIKGTQFRLSALNTAPANASATGTLGEIRLDASYIYICTATNTWKRVAIATW